MSKLSVYIIAYNEEDKIRDAIQSVAWADEIVVALVVTDCGRPHPRIGGLKKEEAKMEDGLR